MSENKRVKNILQTKEGFKITTSQALAKIRSLRRWKTRDGEYFELNGLWHDLLQLYQFIEQEKKWNGEKSKLGILSEAERQLLYCKVERVILETYPCSVLIKTLEE